MHFVEENVDLKSDNVTLLLCLNKIDLIEDFERRQKMLEELSNKAEEYNYTLNKIDFDYLERREKNFEDLLNREQKYDYTLRNLVFLISSKNDDDVKKIRNYLEYLSLKMIIKRRDSHLLKINIGLIGPSKVGKTSLIEKIINKKYIKSKTITIHYQKGTSFIGKIKNFFETSDLPTYIQINECYDNLKNYGEIKYNYYDIPNLYFYKKKLNDHDLKNIDIDIIIFVNDKKKKYMMIIKK